ncbi:tyrosine-protein phosphatase [Candidatus Cardinium hertigii]|uniref:tyrosine-protein phosphatase n=1 Tax=Candidatus Cardinium hertigii TaxID=247481 RepID=UPI003D7DF775
MVYSKHYMILGHLMVFLSAFRSCYTSNNPSDLTPPPISKIAHIKAIADCNPKHKQIEQLSKSVEHKKNDVAFDFETNIEILRKIADVKRGIRWHLSGDNLIREVIDKSDSLYAAEDYAVQIMNIYRAAKKICELYEKNGTPFEKMAHTFMEQYKYDEKEREDFWMEKLKDINKTVVAQLHEIVLPNEEISSINTKLRLAENYVGLDDTHYNVTTVFKINDKKFGLEDKKWLQLTEKQKSAFRKRKSADWYNRLDPFERKLIDGYLDKFLGGNHYIPTQIRNIPGCRNGYQKRILAYDQYNKPITLGRYYHSGALVSPTQWKDETITNDNWEQIQQFVKNIEVISLNHNLFSPTLGGEKPIVEGTRRVVGDNQFMYIPINELGTFTTPMFRPQVDKLIEESIHFYNPKKNKDKHRYQGLCKAFKEGNKKDRQKEIEKVKNPKDKRYFSKLNLLKEATENADYENTLIHNVTQLHNNYYATIGSSYISCKAVLGEKTPTSSVLFSCKSGKDRTGFMSVLVDGNMIRMHDPSLDIEKGTKVYTSLAYASHYQFLASVNGGMAGRFGMKPVRNNDISRNITNELFPKTALSTSIDLN